MQKTSKTVEYLKGIPTAIDVRTIRERWPDAELAEGVDIAGDEDIAELIHESGYRLHTVISAWRRAVERESGKIIGKRDGQYYVLPPAEHVELVAAKQRSGVRAVRRSVRVSVLTDRKRLTTAEVARLDHADMMASRLLEVERLRRLSPSAMKELPPTTPPAQAKED